MPDFYVSCQLILYRKVNFRSLVYPPLPLVEYTSELPLRIKTLRSHRFLPDCAVQDHTRAAADRHDTVPKEISQP